MLRRMHAQKRINGRRRAGNGVQLRQNTIFLQKRPRCFQAPVIFRMPLQRVTQIELIIDKSGLCHSILSFIHLIRHGF